MGHSFKRFITLYFDKNVGLFMNMFVLGVFVYFYIKKLDYGKIMLVNLQEVKCPMDKETLALHETMDTHEILNFKTVCLLRSKLMQGICFDNDLKALMEKDVQQGIKDINELLRFYKKPPTTQ